MALRSRVDRSAADAPFDRAASGGRRTRVGFEDPDELAAVADDRGWAAGQVRLDPGLVVGEESASSVELLNLGRARARHWQRREAEECGEARKTEVTAADRASAERTRAGHLRRELQQKRDELPRLDSAAAAAGAKLDTEQREYWALPASERSVPVVGSLVRLEIALLLAALFDAAVQLKPFQAADLASGPLLWIQIAVLAGGLWAAINFVGLLAGKLALGLEEGRQRVGVVAFVTVLGVLIVGFGLLGLARHGWTSQENRALIDAARGRVAVPALLDPWFVSALQLAVAAAGIIGVALYVLSERGRGLQATLAERAGVVAERCAAVTACRAEIQSLARRLEEAEVAVHEAQADGLAAAVEREVIAKKWEAERAGEVALARAAIGRKDHKFLVERKAHVNGRSWRIRRQDHWLVRLLNVWSGYVTRRAPDEPTQPLATSGHSASINGRGPDASRKAWAERLVSDPSGAEAE